MSKRHKLILPPIFQSYVYKIRSNLREGYVETRIIGGVSSDGKCFKCQASKWLLFELFLGALQIAEDLRGTIEFNAVEEEEGYGAFGFYRITLSGLTAQGYVERVSQVNDVEPTIFRAAFGRYFDDFYREPFLSLEVEPLNDDFSSNVRLILTQDKLLTISCVNDEDLEAFLPLFFRHGLPRRKRMTMIDAKEWPYRESEITSRLERDFEAAYHPFKGRYDFFGGDEEGDAPMGV